MRSVDVIVPCYRYAHFLRECVDSVLAQPGVDVRVLILDDASPDNTPEVAAALARADARVTYVRHAANKGHLATYNEGIDWASADYFLLLSADDYLLPGALERAANLLDANPEVGFVFGRAIELGADGARGEFGRVASDNHASEMVLTGSRFIEQCFPQNIVPTPTAVVRTALQKAVGGYHPDLPHAGDQEMWLRLAANASVGVLDSLQAVYRKHGNNMSDEYCRQFWLPDVQQRKLVIDRFMETCGHLQRDRDQMHRRMMMDLSYVALGFASQAFNKGETDLSSRLEEVALSFFAGAKTTPRWWKLFFKRTIGLKGWRLIQPAIDNVRNRSRCQEAAVDRDGRAAHG
jgi:glycosyltransferase involved in cell wall biosynthesis